ncbi:MAG: S-layer homology domain-containing protein [Clostridiales bacterium]|nr:S-layer homology domain-containing protein [Clostridiales bacterium]
MGKKILVSKLMAAVLVFGFLTAGFGSSASYSATASELEAQINAVSGLTASVSGSTVTVNGSAHRTTNLNLNINSGVTVNWNAVLTGNATANDYLLTLSGNGTFTIGLGGSITVSSGAGGTVYISGGVTLNVAGGSIESPGAGSAVTIAAGTAGVGINISGGSISSVPNGYAINDGSGMTASSNNTIINVSAGLVEAGSACAIRSTGIASVVTISGGEVRNSAASNTNSVIYMNYAPAPNNNLDNIVVSGGIVRTTNPGNQSYVLQTSQNIRILGGEVLSIAGRTINLVGEFSTATVTGGRVCTDSGTAISTATTTLDDVTYASIVISGGTVEALSTGTALRITGYGSTVAVSGDAKVLAKSGLAIDASGRPASNSVTVGGGLVFAWGNAVNKVISPESKLQPAVGGVVAAWNTATDMGEYPYIQSARNDLSMLPASSVSWDNEPPVAVNGGIRYAATGFLPLDVEVIRNAFTLTIVNGTADGGSASLLVTAGATVNISTQETAITPGLNPNLNPVNGNRFVNWTASVAGVTFGDSETMNTTLVMPDSDLTVTAVFKPLYVFRITGGKITDPPNFDSISYGYYSEGETIHIEAYSAQWNITPMWSKTTIDDGAFGDDSLIETTFTMPGEPVTVFVVVEPNKNYKPQMYSATVANGNISTTTAGVPVGDTSFSGYAGTGLNIVANPPDAGKVFGGWTVTPGVGGVFYDAASAATVYIMHSDDVTITANYIDKTYNLTVNGGTGALGPHIEGENITITAAAPPAGRVFSGWTIESGGGLFGDPFMPGTTFTMPDSDAVIKANYEYLDYTLTVENGVDVLGSGAYHFGESIPVSADPPPTGMKFNRWIIASGSGSFGRAAAADTIFTMPAVDATIRATYSENNGTAPSPLMRHGREPDTATSPLHGDVSHMLNTRDHMAFVAGVGNGLFKPINNMTRAEVAQMFYNLLLDKDVETARSFSDVPENTWCKKAVDSLASLGVIAGRPDGRYYPADFVTRTEFVTIAVRFTNEVLGDKQASAFSDVPETHWAHHSIITASSYGWISGVGDNLFAPDRNISRAEAVTLVNTMLNRVPDKAFIDNHHELVFYSDVAKTYWAFYEIAEASNYHHYAQRDDGGEEWQK